MYLRCSNTTTPVNTTPSEAPRSRSYSKPKSTIKVLTFKLKQNRKFKCRGRRTWVRMLIILSLLFVRCNRFIGTILLFQMPCLSRSCFGRTLRSSRRRIRRLLLQAWASCWTAQGTLSPNSELQHFLHLHNFFLHLRIGNK